MTKEKTPKKPKKLWQKILLTILGIILLIVVLFALWVVVLTIREYDPEDEEALEITGEAEDSISVGDSLTVMTWNIGYGALQDTADFWMDGGSSVNTASKDEVIENMESIVSEIHEIDPDVLYLQEVDVDATRSHHINESSYILDNTAGYNSTFAINFLVDYIPIPIPPMGKEYAGIQTLSKYTVDSSTRIQLPCPFSWPSRIVNLKRCLMVDRVPIEGSDKELVLVNLHLEAYDSGEGKIAQTKMLKELLETESAAGNYVIAAGDFNQIFSNVDNPYPVYDGMWEAGEIDVTEFDDSLEFYMDTTFPSCRSLDKAYEGADADSFQYYIIDGFIVSDNVSVTSISTQNLEFANSDHNPVVLHATLSQEE